MSEELEWELYDIFESGRFAFPIGDHKSARSIVRYLLHRGILGEEIADAIEDSTIDLEIWLNHAGKNMVGEWVIAWINETREEYILEKERMGEYIDQDVEYREVTPSYTTTTESGDQDYSSDTELKTLLMIDQSGSEAELTKLGNATVHADVLTEDNLDSCDDIDLDRPPSYSPPPPPLPPRTLRKLKDMNEELIQHRERAKYTAVNKGCLDNMYADDEGLTSGFYEIPITRADSSEEHHSSSENIYETTMDSGASCGLYSSIPVEVIDDDVAINDPSYNDHFLNNANDNSEILALTTQSSPDFTHLSKSGLPICPRCTCKLTHFSLNTHNHKEISLTGHHIHDEHCDKDCHKDQNENHDMYCDLYLYSEAALRAMEYAFETLDKDGPGFIFIMTDCVKQCLPWSYNCRYKVASSRAPERCLMEFKSRDFEIELIWQVKVQYHLSAVREVQSILMEYNMHTNWFKCPFSTIVETVAKIAKKYKEE